MKKFLTVDNEFSQQLLWGDLSIEESKKYLSNVFVSSALQVGSISLSVVLDTSIRHFLSPYLIQQCSSTFIITEP